MREVAYSVADLLPHRGPMVLLDQILACDETTLEAVITIRPASLFCGPQGVPVHVGLEYMAQACGAHVGALARDAGMPVRIGFLLGTRRYQVYVPCFYLGDLLVILVAVDYRDEKMGSYQCTIRIGDRIVAEAQLNFYQPDDAELSIANGVTGP